MSCGKCSTSKLCPISFGLALGLTAGLVMMAMVAWSMFVGLPPEVAQMMPPLDWMVGIKHALWAVLKGFIFGFILALIYDMILCVCKGKCCCKKDGNGSCGTK